MIAQKLTVRKVLNILFYYLVFFSEKISLIWDKTGKYYNLGKGLMLFIDKKLAIKKDKIQKIIFTQNFK